MIAAVDPNNGQIDIVSAQGVEISDTTNGQNVRGKIASLVDGKVIDASLINANKKIDKESNTLTLTEQLQQDETINGIQVGKGSIVKQYAGNGRMEVDGIVNGKKGHFTIDSNGNIVRLDAKGGQNIVSENIIKETKERGTSLKVADANILGALFEARENDIEGFSKYNENILPVYGNAFRGDESYQRKYAQQLTKNIESLLREKAGYGKDVSDVDVTGGSVSIGTPGKGLFGSGAEGHYRHDYQRTDKSSVSIDKNRINEQINEIIDKYSDKYQAYKDFGMNDKQALSMLNYDLMRDINEHFNLNNVNDRMQQVRKDNNYFNQVYNEKAEQGKEFYEKNNLNGIKNYMKNRNH